MKFGSFFFETSTQNQKKYHFFSLLNEYFQKWLIKYGLSNLTFMSLDICVTLTSVR